MKRIVFSIICVVTFLTGCATTAPIMITSDPAGAAIYVDGELLGKTPAKIKVKFPETGQGVTEKKILQVRMTGYKDKKEVLSDSGPSERTINFKLEAEDAAKQENSVVNVPSATPSMENKTAPASTHTPDTK